MIALHSAVFSVQPSRLGGCGRMGSYHHSVEKATFMLCSPRTYGETAIGTDAATVRCSASSAPANGLFGGRRKPARPPWQQPRDKRGSSRGRSAPCHVGRRSWGPVGYRTAPRWARSGSAGRDSGLQPRRDNPGITEDGREGMAIGHGPPRRRYRGSTCVREGGCRRQSSIVFRRRNT